MGKGLREKIFMKLKSKFYKEIKDHNNQFIKLINLNEDNINKLKKIYNFLIKIKKNKKKILIAGNGGSAAIASHFSVDLTKNGKIRCVNFNESDLLTCFSNDYGYENWVMRSLDFYADKGDLVILISASGNSKNMINAAKYALKKKIDLITLTGFNGNNRLSKFGKINLIVNSKKFNHIENTHQYLLLLLVDMLMLAKKKKK